MAGLDPAIHAARLRALYQYEPDRLERPLRSVRLNDVDGRVKPGHDDGW
jgi:hypothetical protein